MTVALVHAAEAADELAASLRLRGGFDSNPLFSNGGAVGGSAFIGADTSLAAARREDGYSIGIAAEAGDVQYANRLVAPAMNGKVILRGMLGDDTASVRSTTTISDISNYSLRSSDLVQSVKGEARLGTIRVFATVEGARSSINQTNAIFQDFLPEPQQFLRGTIIPGLVFLKDKLEIGTSVNLSIRRYTQEFDVFGYRRDNERVQPFLFARYNSPDLNFSGTISRLYGKWHDIDFSDVNTLLFDASLTWRRDPLTFNLSASRQANETTFPISPITIDSAYIGKVAWQASFNLTISAAAGYTETRYLDSPFSARTTTYAAGVSRDLGDDIALGFDVTYARGMLISGEQASATVISTSLTKKFAPSAIDMSRGHRVSSSDRSMASNEARTGEPVRLVSVQ